MRAQQIARGGMMVGVSVVILYFATFLSIASWAACMLVGFIPELFFLVEERKTGCLVYAATSALALFLLPDKLLAILYAGLFGLYTVIRYYLEKLPSRILRWAGKLVFANLWIIIVLTCIRLGILPEFPAMNIKIFLAVLLGGNVILVYYELCLSRIFPGMRGLAQRLNNSFK
ncbi:MAG: hypothetical protein KHY76_04230 [Butyricicoccus pullicaecorum]|nr:hypothetical protein [Butyricicoccus pullicaecorum]